MSDLTDTLTKLTKTITKSSSEILKTTKLTVNLSTEEDKLKNIYIDIGKQVHEIYRYGGSLGKYFDQKFIDIEEQEQKIDELRESLGKIRGTKECRNCGTKNMAKAEYCSKCGLKMDNIEEIEKKPNSYIEKIEVKDIIEVYSDEKPQNKVICKSCFAENPVNSKFCLSCGRMI